MREDLKAVVDKKGRTFERGSAVAGLPGIAVAEIVRVGSYVTVMFCRETVPPAVPPPMQLHCDDLTAFEKF